MVTSIVTESNFVFALCFITLQVFNQFTFVIAANKNETTTALRLLSNKSTTGQHLFVYVIIKSENCYERYTGQIT